MLVGVLEGVLKSEIEVVLKEEWKDGDTFSHLRNGRPSSEFHGVTRPVNRVFRGV